MTTFETIADPPAGAPGDLDAVARVRAHFTGKTRAYWRLMIRGALLQVVTLGIYRFWLTTDMRSFLWANTDVGGESPEYTGTAIELLLGFLIAIAILVPVYGMFFIASLELGLFSQLAGIVAFFVLAAFGQYAIYRARRYRLTRTVFRGVRFHQGGSAWAYAGRSVLWWVLILLTLGLAYPWAQANLERYKLSHTYYGDLQGTFVQTGGALFRRGLLLWLLMVGPFVVSLVIAALVIDWAAIASAGAQGSPDDAGRILARNRSFATALGIVGSAFGWILLLAVILYPAFQAVVLRWWLSGLRFGDVAVSTSLRTRQVYGAYLRYLLYVVLFAIVFSIGAGVAAAVLALTVDLRAASTARDVLLGGLVIAGYVLAALGVATIYQVIVKLALWRMAVESLEIDGWPALDRVHAVDQQSSAVGEGLADALGAGGI